MIQRNLLTLTLLTFCIGVGIGVSWDFGLIPLTITPANSGTLGIEVAHRESLPPPNEEWNGTGQSRHTVNRNLTADDPEIFEQQTEPEVQGKPLTLTSRASESELRETQFAFRNSETTEESVDEPEQKPRSEPSQPASPVRTRDRNALQLNSQAGIEEAPSEPSRRRVKVTNHQDPSDSASDDRRSPREQLTSAEDKLAAGDTLAAHRELSKLYWNNKEMRPQLQEMIDSTAKAIFFQPKPHYIDPYVIQEGERLETIAKKYNLTWEYVAHLNQTDPKRIQIGQKLKVVKGPFAAVVDLDEFALTIHLQGYYVKRYPVGIGQDGASPIGKFPVGNKVVNPQYTDRNGKVTSGDDPSNPLGERWIDLGNSYGIHGTIDPGSIGKAKSRGCIRMHDKDIIEVYDFLVKGSEVVIRK